jgi:hypothetical protein
MFVSSRRRASSSQRIAFFRRRERFRIMSERIIGSYVSRSGGLFILRSSLRPLSGRVAFHPECFPWSTHCAPPTARGWDRITQSPCAVKRRGEPRLAGRGGSGRGTSAIGARPDGITRCGREVACGIDRRQIRRRRLWPIASEHR